MKIQKETDERKSENWECWYKRNKMRDNLKWL